jgi:hypothetical protein
MRVTVNMKMPHPPAWLLLVHQLPPRPTHVRVKIWRRLQDLGAVAFKNSVYVLPHSAQSREDFEWVRTEIRALGGEATVFTADSVDTFSNDDVAATFRRAREADYATLERDAKAMSARPAGYRTTGPARRARVQRGQALQARLAHLDAIAFFPPKNRDAAAAAVAQAVSSGDPAETRSARTDRLKTSAFHGRVWVTRPRPGIDRMASAWLIRRFIDAKAHFAFSPTPPAAGKAIAFDMYGVEFGHTEGGCTFETLVARFGLAWPPITRIAHIVHDLDLKETRYGPAEAAAFAALVEGLRLTYAADAILLKHGMVLFEALYRSFLSESGPARRVRASRRR